jgi:carboxyl-terminal processing protease
MRLVVQSPGQEARQVEVAAKVRQERRVIDLVGKNATFDVNELIRESETSAQLRGHRFRKIGGAVIWKMPTFSFVPEQVDSIIGEYVRGNSALILDLRGNGGGYIETLERLAGYFFDHDVKIADRKGRKPMKPMIGKTRGKDGFTGKLIVLIDSKSGSSSELFARLVQLEKRGVVIGDTSAGAVMQSIFHQQEMGVNTIVMYGTSITDADVIMGDGKSLEHTGVQPDELLLPTAEDMAAKRDPVLVRAAELVGVKLDPAKAGAMFPIEWKK